MSSNSGINYHQVPNEEKDGDVRPEDIILVQANRLSPLKITLLLLIAVVATFVTVFSAVGAALSRHPEYIPGNHNDGDIVSCISNQSESSHTPRYNSCGHSPAEARSRDCKFDISSFSWLTPECFDDSLMQEFISWSNWTWYTSDDPDDNTQLPFERVMLGEEDMFVDWNYHMVHCTFMWRQQHEATERGWIGRHLVHYDHTVHCQHSLLKDAYKNRNVRTPARVIYPPCLKIGTMEGMYPGLMS